MQLRGTTSLDTRVTDLAYVIRTWNRRSALPNLSRPVTHISLAYRGSPVCVVTHGYCGNEGMCVCGWEVGGGGGREGGVAHPT